MISRAALGHRRGVRAVRTGAQCPSGAVAHRRSNLRAFGDSDQRAGDLKRTSLFPERLHDDGRSGLRFRVPLAVADFQTDRENIAGELTGRGEVPIRLDPWERNP